MRSRPLQPLPAAVATERSTPLSPAHGSSPRIALALVIHNHQPVGNFGWVIEEVYRQAYAPMIAALERHPSVRLALHYSGPLLDWLAAEQPRLLERIGELAARGQVELLGGGYYEPILAALPERDRRAQLVKMRRDLERRFGRAPAGAWLAERVWEPSTAHDLATACYRYTVLDDNHLRAASIADDDMWGSYTTDDQGQRLTIFGTEKGLRYLIPFRPVPELIAYLRRHATVDGRRLGTMGDDGEKFGAWPGTEEHCWGSGRWIDECFTALAANADWLTTVTPTDWLDREPPLGRVYVPTSSYIEMTEWALPADQARPFHDALEQAEREGAPAAPFIRGGLWRNFQARYREINDMHKQMLRASAAVDAMPAGQRRNRAHEHLLRGQSNDCYWHGLFGGIYLPHMRLATLAELVAAEDLAAGEGALHGVADYDLDGRPEVLLANAGQSVLVDPAEGGGIGAWDLRASRLALASVLRRRPEAYHQQLRDFETAQARGEKGSGRTLTSIHDQLMVKEKGLSRFLIYDDHERRSGLVRVLVSGRQRGHFLNGEWQVERSTATRLVLSRAERGLELRRTIVLGGGRLDPRLTVRVEALNATARPLRAELELEFNLNLLGGGANPAAYYRFGQTEKRHDSRGAAPAGTRLHFGNAFEGVALAVSASPAAPARWYPVETVSNSEAGFERVYQGSCLLYRWPLELGPGQGTKLTLTVEVRQSPDRRSAKTA